MIRKIPINELISGISVKIIIPIIIAKIRCTYSAILFTSGEPTLYAAIKQNIPIQPVVEINSINPIVCKSFNRNRIRGETKKTLKF